MNIRFRHIKIQNFMSIGKELTHDFKEGIDLIVGTNGSGKSLTSSDSIFYALFGKPYRKVKTTSLQNKINKKNLLVTLDFEVNDEPYTIVRGMNPNIFKIYKGGTEETHLIPQTATLKEYQTYLEDYIICTNETIIRQLMILGTNSNSSKPFLELSQSEKEDMFSTITDTKIFGYLKDILRRKTLEQKTQATELTYKTNLLMSTIASEKVTVEQMKRQNDDFNANHDIRVKQMEDEINTLKESVEKYTAGLQKLKEVKVKYDENMAELKGFMDERAKITDEISKLKHNLNHIASAEQNAVVCSECNHTNYLTEVDVTQKDSLNEKLAELTSSLTSINEKIHEAEQVTDKQKEGLLNGKRLKDTLDDHKRQIEVKTAQIEQLNKYVPVVITYDEIERKEAELVQAKIDLEEVNTKVDDYSYLSTVIGSDNLKGLIISRQLPILNKFINSYLEKFSLLGYNFIVDKDFKEHIISRGEETEFNLLSNGQKSRISFAIMFAFLRLIEERNGTKLNILTLDEALDSSLDTVGREELLNILKTEFSKEKNIIIVSHNEEVKEKIEIFDRIISVSRDTFTKIDIEEI